MYDHCLLDDSLRHFSFLISCVTFSGSDVSPASFESEASSFTCVDGMVTALRCDGKNFYTAVAGGPIRKYPLNVNDLTQSSDDVFTLEDSHITCIDSSRDKTPRTHLRSAHPTEISISVRRTDASRRCLRLTRAASCACQ
jgi:hypothetical protein